MLPLGPHKRPSRSHFHRALVSKCNYCRGDGRVDLGSGGATRYIGKECLLSHSWVHLQECQCSRTFSHPFGMKITGSNRFDRAGSVRLFLTALHQLVNAIFCIIILQRPPCHPLTLTDKVKHKIWALRCPDRILSNVHK